jgi:hypothetical protein
MTTYLAMFPPNERAHLISLFYRAGMWISQVDDDGAQSADDVEAQTLARLLGNVAKNPQRSAFVREVAGEALRQKDNWTRWNGNLDQFIGEAQQGVRILKPIASPPEIIDFIAGLRALAEAVAMANHEDSDAEDHTDIEEGGILGKLKRLLPQPKLSARNISPLEDDALTELARALKQV